MPQDFAGVFVAPEVPLPHPLDDDLASQVDKARLEVVDVELQADGRIGARRRCKRHGGAARLDAGDWRLLDCHPCADHLVDEPGDGWPGEPGRGCEVTT